MILLPPPSPKKCTPKTVCKCHVGFFYTFISTNAFCFQLALCFPFFFFLSSSAPRTFRLDLALVVVVVVVVVVAIIVAVFPGGSQEEAKATKVKL